MNIQNFENLIINELQQIINQIITDNLFLNISAKSRAGAEISHFLESKFVEYTINHHYFFDSIQAPLGQTKNPWDAKAYFKVQSYVEEIWIDFKAFKITSKDSNPDIGTPTKIINFIKQGGFYLVYVYVFYQEKENGLEFVCSGNEYAKIYFLKDISHTVRRNPKNQLQVNISEPPEYRTREQFIELLINKIKESHERQIKISEKQLKILDHEKEDMILKNKESEDQIIQNT
ncbi:TPA: hypothetical protein JBG15_14600 [Legionella pneumophila]|nr:hypothetical protein [Legionella pneumophila]